jgi:hypothetical protein
MKKNWFNATTLAISIIALIFSYLSWQISKQSFEYGVEKDSMMNTPALQETIDSLSINFSLNSGADLQMLSIIFPKEVSKHAIIIAAKPMRLVPEILENIAKQYLRDKVKINDSIAIVGTVAIPVMINYSAVVFGDSQDFRENRTLVFEIHYYENVENVHFKNTYLISRCGFPLKRHYFYNGPFSGSVSEKIYRQDSIDVQDLLNQQLKFSNMERN